MKKIKSRKDRIDWIKLEKEFIRDLTSKKEIGITGDFTVCTFHAMPYQVFEWFKNKIKNG